MFDELLQRAYQSISPKDDFASGWTPNETGFASDWKKKPGTNSSNFASGWTSPEDDFASSWMPPKDEFASSWMPPEETGFASDWGNSTDLDKPPEEASFAAGWLPDINQLDTSDDKAILGYMRIANKIAKIDPEQYTKMMSALTTKMAYDLPGTISGEDAHQVIATRLGRLTGMQDTRGPMMTAPGDYRYRPGPLKGSLPGVGPAPRSKIEEVLSRVFPGAESSPMRTMETTLDQPW